MKKQFEVTFIDNGVTKLMTYKQCVEVFGKAEFKEILLGYAPHIVAVQVN